MNIEDKISMTIKQKIYLVSSVILLFGMGFFIIVNAPLQSFWSDEMSTIGYIRSDISFWGVVKGYMLEDAVNLPLYQLILKVFYELMPYGEVYLLLPSIIFFMIAIVLIAILGYKCGNEDIAFFCICFGTIAGGAIRYAAWDIRCYALLIMMSALTILLYVKRCEDESMKNIWLLGISMLLLFFAHWYGAIMMMAFALSDLVLWLQKKIKIRCIVSYLLAGGILFIYLILMLKNTGRDLSGHYGKPGMEDIRRTLYLITGDRFWCLVLFLIGCLLIAIGILKNVKNEIIWKVLLFSCVWTFGVAYFVKQGAFFGDRYFQVILPQTILIMALSLDIILKWIFKVSEKILKKYNIWLKRVAVIFLILYFGKYVYQNYESCYEFHMDERMPYRQSAEFLVENGKIYEEDTLFISGETCNLTEAWLEYYFEKRGFALPNRTIVHHRYRKTDSLEYWKMISAEEILQYDNIIVFSMSAPLHEDIQNFVDEYYREEERYFGDRVRIYVKIK